MESGIRYLVLYCIFLVQKCELVFLVFAPHLLISGYYILSPPLFKLPLNCVRCVVVSKEEKIHKKIIHPTSATNSDKNDEIETNSAKGKQKQRSCDTMLERNS
ncbi:transmembrane protein, putative [Bodo saltans]|uniref:Transmembrane protein, putative n=1 Tax=Bodo saltans TaxID=75058 RepID=A0A0S4IMF7_BODSA|nr:transmembrane protein, putative [Bodo saltans]|eukprot:CUE72895.1 transmembrane protein, putative [Bodo saltans]